MAYYNRKHIRLKNYDYSRSAYYYVTIHTEKDRHILSHIRSVFSDVGRGLAPASLPEENYCSDGYPKSTCKVRADIQLTNIGQTAEDQLIALEDRFDHVKIDSYVIMPNHIHAVIILLDNASVPGGKAGASPRPTLSDIVGAYKSVTTRLCNKNDNAPGRKIFQTSFYESIIRNENAYYRVLNYIKNNPMKWIINNKNKMINGGI